MSPANTAHQRSKFYRAAVRGIRNHGPFFAHIADVHRDHDKDHGYHDDHQ
jgi:hypothetical protein